MEVDTAQSRTTTTIGTAYIERERERERTGGGRRILVQAKLVYTARKEGGAGEMGRWGGQGGIH